ncbi:hypothetical protein BG003_000615, partial [Podila horticola]
MILSESTIQIIPIRRVSNNIFCTTASCNIGLVQSVTVSTTHSAEVGFSVMLSAKPFGMGAEFITS